MLFVSSSNFLLIWVDFGPYHATTLHNLAITWQFITIIKLLYFHLGNDPAKVYQTLNFSYSCTSFTLALASYLNLFLDLWRFVFDTCFGSTVLPVSEYFLFTAFCLDFAENFHLFPVSECLSLRLQTCHVTHWACRVSGNNIMFTLTVTINKRFKSFLNA